MPSSRQSTPVGELPRTVMLLSPMGSPATPGKALTMRAGSLMLPAMREVSSTLMVRALSVAMSLRTSPRGRSAVTVTAVISVTVPESMMFSTNSLAEFSKRFSRAASS
jgi:hypothetical protein